MSSLTNIPQGVFGPQAVAAIEQAINQMGLFTTGTIYYLDPVNGLDVNDGLSPETAVKTLGAGYTLLAQGKNDTLVLISDGTTASTARLSAGFTWAKNATRLIGLCAPSLFSQRARIAPTSAIAAFANFFTVTASDCVFANLEFFQGFNVGVAAEICLTLSSGSRNVFKNCHIAGMGDVVSATDAGSRCLLVKSGSQENYFQNCVIGLDTVERTLANASVEFQGGAPRCIFDNCYFPFWSSDGLQYAFLAAVANALDRFVFFKGCNFVAGLGTAIAAILHAAAGQNGIICLDSGCGAFNVTAIGDATTKGQTFVSGGTATNGVKGIVAS